MKKLMLTSLITLITVLFAYMPTANATLVNGHPVNSAGFVTDGSPQLDDAHCVGTFYQIDHCLAARNNGFVTSGRPQLDDEHCVGPLREACLYARRGWAWPPQVHIADLAYSYASGIPRNAREACIVQRENGGSYAFGTNPTHMGRYQFSYQTWVAYGGNPNTWSNASPQEQDQVFITAVSRNGYNDWAPYDGC